MSSSERSMSRTAQEVVTDVIIDQQMVSLRQAHERKICHI